MAVTIVLEEPLLLREVNRTDRCPICKRDIVIDDGEPRLYPR